MSKIYEIPYGVSLPPTKEMEYVLRLYWESVEAAAKELAGAIDADVIKTPLAGDRQEA